MIWYLARRKLGLSPDEWDDLPWHHQRVYMEGFEQEELIQYQNNSPAGAQDGASGDALWDALSGANWTDAAPAH